MSGRLYAGDPDGNGRDGHEPGAEIAVRDEQTEDFRSDAADRGLHECARPHGARDAADEHVDKEWQLQESIPAASADSTEQWDNDWGEWFECV